MEDYTDPQKEVETGKDTSDDTPAPEEQKTGDDTAAAETRAEGETEGEDPPKEKPKQDPRDKELAYHRRRAEREARDLREHNRRLAEENAALRTQERPSAEPKTAGPPRQEDYADFNEYHRAMVAYEVDQRMAQTQADSAQHQRQTRAEAGQAALAQRWQDLAEKGAETFEDFEEVAYDFPQTETMVVAIVNSEVGEQVAYHLGSQPNEAAKIARMNPVDQVKAIGRLEAKLSAKPEKRATNAKEPPSKVAAGGGGDAGKTPYTARSYDDYVALRRKQEEAKRR